jgi:DNA end-binding protein Ku
VQLINRQSAKYDPSDLEDRYEIRLREMIDAKLAGMPVKADDETPSKRGNIIDLVAALSKSLAESTAAETRAAKGVPKGPPPTKGSPQPASKASRKRA